MTMMNEIMNVIVSAFLQVDFIQIDNNEFVYAGEVVDGVQQYHSIKFGTKATKDTKTHKAFDLDNAIEKYNEKKSKAAERVAKPKATHEGNLPRAGRTCRGCARSAFFSGVRHERAGDRGNH